MLYGGVSADGPAGIFKNNRFSVRMISADPGNPGNFVMYRFSGGGTLQVGLQAVGSILSVSEFTIPIGGMSTGTGDSRLPVSTPLSFKD